MKVSERFADALQRACHRLNRGGGSRPDAKAKLRATPARNPTLRRDPDGRQRALECLTLVSFSASLERAACQVERRRVGQDDELMSPVTSKRVLAQL